MAAEEGVLWHGGTPKQRYGRRSGGGRLDPGRGGHGRRTSSGRGDEAAEEMGRHGRKGNKLRRWVWHYQRRRRRWASERSYLGTAAAVDVLPGAAPPALRSRTGERRWILLQSFSFAGVGQFDRKQSGGGLYCGRPPCVGANSLLYLGSIQLCVSVRIQTTELATEVIPNPIRRFNTDIQMQRYCFWMCKLLMQRNATFILPLVIATFIMRYVDFISLPSQDRTKLIFPYNKLSYIFRSNFDCFLHR
jgi:hypothetical protein